MKPSFNLITAMGPKRENPTAAAIAALFARLPFAGDDDYFIIEKSGAEFEGAVGTYLQGRPHRQPQYEGVFLIEYRDGASRRHYATHIEAGAPLVSIVASYLADDEDWLDLAVWRDISYRFEDLRAMLPEEELASSFFADDEWQQALEAKKQRDAAFWQELDRAVE